MADVVEAVAGRRPRAALPATFVSRRDDDTGSAGAFEALYRRSLPEVYRYLSARCESRATAEDLTQDVFLAAARAVRRDGVADISLPWLIGVARHKLIDHFRRRGIEERASAQLLEPSIPEELVLWRGEASRDLALAALHAVPANQRAVLVLRYFDGLAVGEIASVLQKSVHATESLLARGRESFKRGYVEAADD